MKILLVDNSRTSRAYIKRHLNALNHSDIIEAGDGEEALEKLKENPETELILTDLHMPFMDGFGLLKQLKEDPKNSTIPVAMVTSDSGEDERAKALVEYKADYYIEKPVTKQSFVRLFSELEQ